MSTFFDLFTVAVFLAGVTWIIVALLSHRKEISSKVEGKMRGLWAPSPGPFRGTGHAGTPVVAFSVAILIAIGFGVYYRPNVIVSVLGPNAIEAVLAPGKVAIKDSVGQRVEYKIRSMDEFEQTLAKIKEHPLQVNEIHFYMNLADLRPLQDFIDLKSLDLDSTLVDDLEPIKNLTSLTALDLGKTPFYDLDQLKYFPNLQWLDLSETKVSDWKPLTKLGGLQILDLEGTEINDLAPLSKLKNLTRLNISNTQISDLRPLSALTALEELDLSLTDVGDVEPLYGLSALKMLNLSDTPVERQQIELLRERLSQAGNTSVQVQF